MQATINKYTDWAGGVPEKWVLYVLKEVVLEFLFRNGKISEKIVFAHIAWLQLLVLLALEPSRNRSNLPPKEEVLEQKSLIVPLIFDIIFNTTIFSYLFHLFSCPFYSLLCFLTKPTAHSAPSLSHLPTTHF